MSCQINKLIGVLGFFVLSTIFITCSSEKQVTSFSQNEITQAVNNNRWTFTADNASPSYGRARNLTYGYFVTCRTDTLITSLPYYGRLTSPAGVMNGNPLDFTSTKFTLTKENRKNGGWVVTINRPDQEVQSMTFTLYDNGSAQLNVIMTNRSGISFNGRVTPAIK